MNYIPLAIYLMQLYCEALSTLPAPVNVTIESVNFEHILKWNPGAGTPPGTGYRVTYSHYGSRWRRLPASSATMVNVTEKFTEVTWLYAVRVQAVNGAMKSPMTATTFRPYKDTVLGPPQVSLAGCGNCLKINITFPRGRAKESIEDIYGVFRFNISWKKIGEIQVQHYSTQLSSSMLENLHPGVEHCIQVKPQLAVNKNTLRSGWVCALTSPGDQSPVPTVLAGVSGILLALGGVILIGLIYAGFLFKLKTHLPRVLTSMVEADYFSMDSIIPDPVSVTFEPTCRGKGDGAEVGDEDEEDEEDRGNNAYERRAARFSSGTSSGCTSCAAASSVTSLTTATTTTDSSGNTQTSINMAAEVRVPLIVEVLEVCRQTEDGKKSAEPDLLEDEEWDQECCTDVNLLSVTLGAQEEERGDAMELFGDGPDEGQPLLSVEPPERSTDLSSTQRAGPVTQTAEELCLNIYEGTDSALTELTGHCRRKEYSDKEEDDDDDECSGYIRH
ncbi:interleukin-10 receptor subunit beta-like [Megalops cyprinoides]|uniref:interleukin-10 receptor subunit beta-like n=1 Tax=Megalops cyprinoides TaxID=118141 RepID=UPI001864D327|nr:interleukin-10 receptor subunit beta-like [Megalops cyprinoides]